MYYINTIINNDKILKVIKLLFINKLFVYVLINNL